MPDEVYMQYKINSYLSTLTEAMNRLHGVRYTGGLYKLFNENTEKIKQEYTLFYNYINNLTWQDLDVLMYDNEKINKENIPPIIKDKTNPTDVYYVFIKNTLSTHINDVLKINIPEEIKIWDAGRSK